MSFFDKYVVKIRSLKKGDAKKQQNIMLLCLCGEDEDPVIVGDPISMIKLTLNILPFNLLF